LLSAAAGFVFLTSVGVVAQTYTSQRRVATKSSGTASSAAPSPDLATAGKSAVQRRLDAMYVKFGVKSAPAEPRVSTHNLAKKESRQAPAPAPQKPGAIRQALAEKGQSVPKAKPEIRQTSVQEDAVLPPAPVARQAPAQARKVIERPQSRPAVSESGGARGLIPSFFARRTKTPRQATEKAGGTENRQSVQGNRQSVQDHLRKLYARDGREMPSMDLHQLPASSTTPGQTLSRRQMPQLEKQEAPLARVAPEVPEPRTLVVPEKLRASSPQAEPVTQPIRQVSSNPFKRLIRRITPFRKKTSEQAIAAPPEVIAEQRALENGTLKPAVEAQPIQSETEEVARESSERTPGTPPQTVNPAEVPAFRPLVELPEAAPVQEEELPRTVPEPETEDAPIAASPEKLPPTLDGDLPTLDGEVSDDQYTREVPPGTIVDPADAAFPSLSEGAADAEKTDTAEEKPATPDTEPAQAVEDNPFTGLVLDIPEPEPTDPATAEPETPATDVEADESPLLPSPGVSDEELAVPEIETEAGQPLIEIETPLPAGAESPKQLPSDAPPALKPASPEHLQSVPEQEPTESATPKAPEQKQQRSAEDNPHADKLNRIAARTELRGLKGFCPVELRERRELRDALPQYAARYDGVVYNCSSAAALQKFMARPYLYAPAAGGKDVVLLAGEDGQTQGSLDHAVWYRDRLYLFESAESMKKFVAAPVSFVPGK